MVSNSATPLLQQALTRSSDDVWDEDSAYLEMLANESARQRERLEKKEAGKEVDEDDESDDENVEEELGYLSPLDNVNPYASFKQALTSEFLVFL